MSDDAPADEATADDSTTATLADLERRMARIERILHREIDAAKAGEDKPK